MLFEDRFHAARLLVDQLQEYKNNKDVVIIAIPRGALEIGYVIAHDLHAPLDVLFSKKIGAPGQPEFAIGAVSMHNLVIAPEFAHMPGINAYCEQQAADIRKQLKERDRMYHEEVKRQNLKDKIVILVDDGVATGRTLLLTIDLIKELRPKKIVVALPVGPAYTLDRIRRQVDDLVFVYAPNEFMSVGQFYRNFGQVEDHVAIDLLKRGNNV